MRIGKLTALAVQRAKRRGYYNDGGGLYLRVAESGSKSWVFRFRAAGKLREMGLGPVATLGLKEARERALACRRLRLDGIDPIEKRKAARSEAALKAANALTFRECAERYIAAHHDSWKNAKHAAQWPATLETYAYPVFGELPVDAVDVDLVIKAVEPIWKIKTETASRLRGRIEAVLDWATVRRLRHGENPARWRGHLNQLLPQRSKVQKVQHHAALPYSEIGGFMAELQKLEGAAAGALEFAILTATRTSEVLGAKWEEIDFAERVWTIPAERMKAGREHRVPVSDRAREWMPAERTTMRQVREVLRLRTAGVGLNEIARRVGVSPSTVRLTLKRLASAGFSWPLPAEMTCISSHLI